VKTAGSPQTPAACLQEAATKPSDSIENLPDDAALAAAAWLRALGTPIDADPELQRTPDRVARLWRDNLLSGQNADPAELLGDLIADPDGGLVAITDLPFVCICPHHLLPAMGVAHLAYESGGQVVGFGALERLVGTLGRQLVLQETLTALLADALMTHLGARGAAVHGVAGSRAPSGTGAYPRCPRQPGWTHRRAATRARRAGLSPGRCRRLRLPIGTKCATVFPLCASTRVPRRPIRRGPTPRPARLEVSPCPFCPHAS
jgi:GTP cyclohydrolase I